MIVFNRLFIPLLSVLLDGYIFSPTTSWFIRDFVSRVNRLVKDGSSFRDALVYQKGDSDLIIKLANAVRDIFDRNPEILGSIMLRHIDNLISISNIWKFNNTLYVKCGGESFDLEKNSMWPLRILLKELSLEGSRSRLNEIINDIEKVHDQDENSFTDVDNEFYRDMKKVWKHVPPGREYLFLNFMKNIVETCSIPVPIINTAEIENTIGVLII
jgi:hypothetical protein